MPWFRGFPLNIGSTIFIFFTLILFYGGYLYPTFEQLGRGEMKHLLLVVVCSTSNLNGPRVFALEKIGEDIAFWVEKVV